MKKLLLLLLSLSTISLWCPGALALPQSADAVNSQWNDLEVDVNKAHVVYLNNRDESYLVKVQEPGKKPYTLSLDPGSTTVLSFDCAKGKDEEVKFWNYRKKQWNSCHSLFVTEPKVLWRITSVRDLSPQQQAAREILMERLEVPIIERGKQQESQNWFVGLLGGIVDSLFGPSQNDDPNSSDPF